MRSLFLHFGEVVNEYLDHFSLAEIIFIAGTSFRHNALKVLSVQEMFTSPGFSMQKYHDAKMSLDKQNQHPYTLTPRRKCLIRNKLKGWGL